MPLRVRTRWSAWSPTTYRFEISLKTFCLFVLAVHASGCVNRMDLVPIPPEVFRERPPLTHVLDKVGVNLSDTKVSISSPTAGELFRKEVWNRVATGSNNRF